MARKRDDDRELIEDAENQLHPSHQGTSGGNMARKVGQRDETKTATGEDPLPTGVHGRDKPEGGDMPTPPQRRR